MLNNLLEHQHLHSTPPNVPCPTTAAMVRPKAGMFYDAPHSPVHHPLSSALGTFGSALWPRAASLQCDAQVEFHRDFPGLRLQPSLFTEESGSSPGAFVS